MAHKNGNWVGLIRKLSGSITGLIAFVSAVVGFIKLWQGDTGLVTIVLLVIGVACGLGGCTYVAFKRTSPQIQPPDVYSHYEVGLPKLLDQIGRKHIRYSEALAYQQRLTENIAQSRRYGDTETRRSERSEIVSRLDELALSALGMPFSELCSQAAFTPRQDLGEGISGQYSRWRPWALAGLVIIPLLTISGVGYYLYQEAQPPDKVIILIADFDGPRSQEYRVTETVLTRLDAALKPYSDVEVQALGRAIKENSLDEETGLIGSAAARAEGENRKATIVVWGWYGLTEEAIPLSVHFELLHVPEHLLQLGPEAKGEVQAIAVAELEGFTLQTRLSTEMAYLSLVTLGIVRYATEDWDGAVVSFSDALKQTTDRVPALDQSAVYLYRGYAYYFRGDPDSAIADYDQAIQLKPDLAEAYIGRGLVYVDKNDYDLAIAEFDQALQIDPDTATTCYNNRGLAYLGKGDIDRAIADFNRVIQIEPDFAGTYNNRGLAYLGKGNVDLAIIDFDRAIKLKPDFVGAYIDRGVAYHYIGNLEQAIADYDKAIQINPGEVVAYSNRGSSYVDRGDFGRAIADYNKAIKLRPDYAEAYYGLGNVYAAQEDYDRAIECFDYAIRLRPDFDEAYNNRGLTFYDIGDLDRAIADYDKAILLDPGDTKAYGNRGFAHFLKGNFDLAIADFDQVIMFEPYNAKAYVDRGSAYYQKGDYGRAITDFDQAVQLRSSYAWAGYFNRGLAYHATGEHKRAIADFDQAIRLEPKRAEIYYSRGLAHQAQDEYDQAIADFDQAIQLQPDLADAYLQRGITYGQEGNYDQAILAFDRAIQLQPEDPAAHYNRGLAYALKGEKDKAIAEFKKVLQLSDDPTFLHQTEEQLKVLEQDH